jgi:hypothetical protein
MDDKHLLKRQNFMARLFGSEKFEMPQDYFTIYQKTFDRYSELSCRLA